MIENCHRMAVLAQIAYHDKEEADKEYASVGYPNTDFFDFDGAQCYAVWNDEEYVLCFRGTEPTELSDIAADLNALPDKAVVGGYVHNGFQNELEKIWSDVYRKTEEIRGSRKFYICGHSLGGAMATIAASRFKYRVDCLYTYGSPRAGTKGFVKNVVCTHYRHVNNNDAVPTVPPALFGYRHHGTLRYINHYGNIRKNTPWQRFKDKIRGHIAAWKKREFFDSFRDHSMVNYVSHTRDK
jgi:triacylglycerol lipase